MNHSIRETHRCDVHEPDEEAEHRRARRHPAVPQRRELVAQDRNEAVLQSDDRADAECEQHEEEQYGEHLRNEFEFGDCVRVRDECETSAALDDRTDVFHAEVVRQIPENAENGDARNQTSACVQ